MIDFYSDTAYYVFLAIMFGPTLVAIPFIVVANAKQWVREEIERQHDAKVQG